MLLVAGWLMLVLFMVAQHAFFRDEIRAFSLAMQGSNLPGMLVALHGEGHPAVWYLLLRAAHAIVPSPSVLPAVSVAVALGAAVLLALRSPFGWFIVAALLLGRIGVYEYSVMARNYGISMLVMFAFAALYRRYRDRSPCLGLILLILANCNAHSVILAGALGFFWLVDLILDGARWQDARFRNYWINAAILAFGVVLCALTVYPPVNDAASGAAETSRSLGGLVASLLLPAREFSSLAGADVFSPVLERLPWLSGVFAVGMSVVMYCCVLGLRHRPAAMWAGLLALIGMIAFFAVVYAGNYRHQALWLVLLVCLYWIAGPPSSEDVVRAKDRVLQRIGGVAFVALLLVQVLASYPRVARAIVPSAPLVNPAPESRSRDLARLLQTRPDLARATVVAEPDFLLEALPYYLSNPTYLMREGRYGNVVQFRNSARLVLTLDDILEQATRIRNSTGEPVVILLSERLDSVDSPRIVKSGYNWQLAIDPAQSTRFQSAVPRIQRFDPACCTNESFDVYVMQSRDSP